MAKKSKDLSLMIAFNQIDVDAWLNNKKIVDLVVDGKGFIKLKRVV